MITKSILATLVLFSTAIGHCQDLAKVPAFEVASITPRPPGTPQSPAEHSGTEQFTFPGGGFQAKATTLKFLLEWAYDIQPSQHSPGPSWMETDRYDIVAKAEGEATAEQNKRMVQTLLAERFHLIFHREKKTLPVYVISLGKTAPKLFPPKQEETHSLQLVRQTNPDQKFVTYHVVATRFSLEQWANVFARQLDRGIVNQTGLEGAYDFTIDLTPDETRPSFLDASLLITGMREQLGLTLKAQQLPVDFLVIDSAEKGAAGN
ncbi:MAG: TIGR03435 family protein [Acidobacteriota bacterium]